MGWGWWGHWGYWDGDIWDNGDGETWGWGSWGQGHMGHWDNWDWDWDSWDTGTGIGTAGASGIGTPGIGTPGTLGHWEDWERGHLALGYLGLGHLEHWDRDTWDWDTWVWDSWSNGNRESWKRATCYWDTGGMDWDTRNWDLQHGDSGAQPLGSGTRGTPRALPVPPAAASEAGTPSGSDARELWRASVSPTASSPASLPPSPSVLLSVRPYLRRRGCSRLGSRRPLAGSAPRDAVGTRGQPRSGTEVAASRGAPAVPGQGRTRAPRGPGTGTGTRWWWWWRPWGQQPAPRGGPEAVGMRFFFFWRGCGDGERGGMVALVAPRCSWGPG